MIKFIESIVFSVVYFFVQLVLEILEYEKIQEIEVQMGVDFAKSDRWEVGPDCPNRVADPVSEPVYPQVLHQLGTVEFSKN